MPCSLLTNIFRVSHILLLFHSSKWVAKDERLGKYFPYCTCHRAITTTYISKIRYLCFSWSYTLVSSKPLMTRLDTCIYISICLFKYKYMHFCIQFNIFNELFIYSYIYLNTYIWITISNCAFSMDYLLNSLHMPIAVNWMQMCNIWPRWIEMSW